MTTEVAPAEPELYAKSGTKHPDLTGYGTRQYVSNCVATGSRKQNSQDECDQLVRFRDKQSHLDKT